MLIAVDDSEINIQGIPHTILAAIVFDDPEAACARVEELKVRLGIPVAEELKWNSASFDKATRETVSAEAPGLLADAIGFVTLCEGNDRQHAAEQQALQIGDYIASRNTQTVSLVFDEGIVRDPKRFQGYLRSTARPELMGLEFRSVTSHSNVLVQCADLYAGFQNLLIALELGRKDKVIKLQECFSDDAYASVELSFFARFGFRYTLWGETTDQTGRPTSDPHELFDQGPGPFVKARGMGLRIISTLPSDLQDRLYDQLGLVFMGCIH